MNQKRPLLQIRNLKTYFPIYRGILRRQVSAVRAVDGLTFDIYQGETLGLVGESGCGKSTTGRTILRLVESTEGQVFFQDRDLSRLENKELRKIRRHMQMIFQDPYASLNPRMSVEQLLMEPLLVHKIGDAQQRKRRVRELLELVGLNDNVIKRYPHEFSGGQRQRIGIARALATNPSFVVADEPISALDVSIQAQIVNLLDELKAELGLTYLFIAHDLSMVRYISDRVAVMYLGEIVELGSRDEVFDTPLHPYTQALLAAIPIPDPDEEAAREQVLLKGDVPSPINPPKACRFHPRCKFATEVCREVKPVFRSLSNSNTTHLVACHHAEQFV
jgi:oligopeptide transport system ATP-binding protein